MRAVFAIPGDLGTPTGGYAYARRLIREAPQHGLALEPVVLPGEYPNVTPKTLAAAGEVLLSIPADRPVLVDGLALGILPSAMLRAVRAPLIGLCHHPLALETGLAPESARQLRTRETEALAQCRHVVTTSHATAVILTRDYGVSGARLTVAPPGTDPAPRALAGGDVCRVLSVGSLTPRKGHDRLIAALCRADSLNWTARIIGPPRDTATAAKLSDQIVDAGLEDRISLAGAVPLTTLTAAYQSSDLFVLASAFEGFGMAFTEAMAHGLPVLGLASPAVEEATAGAARLVQPEEFADMLVSLIGDAAERAALADRCWTAAQTLMRWSGTAAIIAGVLNRIDI